MGKENKSLTIYFKVYKQKYPEIKSLQHTDPAQLLTCKHDEFDFEGSEQETQIFLICLLSHKVYYQCADQKISPTILQIRCKLSKVQTVYFIQHCLSGP